MSYLADLKALEVTYGSVVNAPEEDVRKLQRRFYREKIVHDEVRTGTYRSTLQELNDLLSFLRGMNTQNYTAQELADMVRADDDLTYQATASRLRHLMKTHEIAYRHLVRGRRVMQSV